MEIYGVNSVFRLNTGKYGPEKLRIWTLFMQQIMFKKYSILRIAQTLVAL